MLLQDFEIGQVEDAIFWTTQYRESDSLLVEIIAASRGTQGLKGHLHLVVTGPSKRHVSIASVVLGETWPLKEADRFAIERELKGCLGQGS